MRERLTKRLTTSRMLELLLEHHIIKKADLGYVYQIDEDGIVFSKKRAAKAMASLFRYVTRRQAPGNYHRMIEACTREHLIKWPEYESGSAKYSRGKCDRSALMERLLDVDLSKSTSQERRLLSKSLKRFLNCVPEKREEILMKTKQYVKDRFSHLLKDEIEDYQTSSFEPEDMTETIKLLSKSNSQLPTIMLGDRR